MDDEEERKALMKKIEILKGLLEKHNAVKKEQQEMKSLQPNSRNMPPQKSVKFPSHLSQKLNANSHKSSISVHKKYVFKKPHDLSVGVSGSHKVKEESVKNSTKYVSSVSFKSNVLSGASSASQRTVIMPESKSEIIPKPCSKIDKMQFAKEVSSLTEVLKNFKQSSVASNQSSLQNKLSVYTVNNQKQNNNNLSIIKSESNFHGNATVANARSSLDNKLSSCTKLNSNSKPGHLINVLPSKHLNKYTYKNVYVKPVNSNSTTASLNSVENKLQAKNKAILNTHCRKVTFSSCKSLPENICFSGTDVPPPKPLSPNKQNLTTKFSLTKDIPPVDSLCKEYPNSGKKKTISYSKVKSPSFLKSPKSLKLKPANSRYIKINKQLVAPRKSSQVKIVQRNSVKKITKKVNTKYKLVNKTLTPSFNKKKLNLLNNSGSKENSPVVVDETDSFLKELNNSEMDKIEKDLLAISKALISTPISSVNRASSSKASHHLKTKVDSNFQSKKMPPKTPKKSVSKYKIVNSNAPKSYSLKKQNFTSLKTGYKKVNYSKFSVVNKHLQTGQMLSPVKQRNSVLVKRIFKSKNAIINKNVSQISQSAKMIKCKYFSLNKRKFHSWQDQIEYGKIPSHNHKFRGYYLKTKLPCSYKGYPKPSTSIYHPRVIRQFSLYGYSTTSKEFIKNASTNKYRRKLKNGYVHSPLVFIRGVKYSQNSSGKTLKKLPFKGQTQKSLRTVAIGTKPFLRNPLHLVKTLPLSASMASRVLHRSINRIITASTKKSLTKTNSYCMFYNRFGRCNSGVKCKYIHDPSKIAVCTRFLRGTCRTEGCPFSHEITPGKMAICSFFLVGACEKENCPYRHEKLLPDAVLCKSFVQGYCPNGKECKKAHILVCPKYIQGECDKGNACPFPHPPKKLKKNVQKEEKDEEKKCDDVLEKVCRYFLQMEDCLSDEIRSNQVVPNRRSRLEEQPSFISLTSHNS